MKSMGHFVSSSDASMMSGEIDTQRHTNSSTQHPMKLAAPDTALTPPSSSGASLREKRDSERPLVEDILSINEIAAGLRNTG
jgi:hypothetical protein